MKVKINSNTRLNSQHLEKDTIYDLENKHAEYLIKLGRATYSNFKVEDLLIENSPFEISVVEVPSLRGEEINTLIMDEVDNWQEDIKETSSTKKTRKTRNK